MKCGSSTFLYSSRCLCFFALVDDIWYSLFLCFFRLVHNIYVNSMWTFALATFSIVAFRFFSRELFWWMRYFFYVFVELFISTIFIKFTRMNKGKSFANMVKMNFLWREVKSSTQTQQRRLHHISKVKKKLYQMLNQTFSLVSFCRICYYSDICLANIL